MNIKKDEVTERIATLFPRIIAFLKVEAEAQGKKAERKNKDNIEA